ncbi:MAG: hypothetical protein SFY81_17055, partial [Verrucomicrobiota bacterium]|nr:hypothetical protein [Verrucomicrobiota bacterium]
MMKQRSTILPEQGLGFCAILAGVIATMILLLLIKPGYTTKTSENSLVFLSEDEIGTPLITSYPDYLHLKNNTRSFSALSCFDEQKFML